MTAMCTLIALHQVVSGYPLVVGMNRDEFRNRPAAPWSPVSGNPKIVAPRDAKAGGTWIGVNEHGLVVALSNRRGRDSTTARSRGVLVVEALGRNRPASVDLLVRSEVEAHEYNFFHLFAANGEEMRCWRYDGAVNVRRGVPGLNVLTNQGLNEEGDTKVLAVRRMVRPSDTGDLGSALKSLQAALRYRGTDVEVCNHGAMAGTVSSSILAVHSDDPRENALLFSDGLPCQAPFRDLSSLLRAP